MTMIGSPFSPEIRRAGAGGRRGARLAASPTRWRPGLGPDGRRGPRHRAGPRRRSALRARGLPLDLRRRRAAGNGRELASATARCPGAHAPRRGAAHRAPRCAARRAGRSRPPASPCGVVPLRLPLLESQDGAGPLVGGLLIHAFGVHAVYLVAAILTLSGAWLVGREVRVRIPVPALTR